MNLSELCIRRPVFATMINLVIILMGTIGLSRLPVRELPDIDPPIVSITTIYPGANAEVIETEITEKLEQEINNIPGIKTLTSESREEVSIITVSFELDRDVDIGAQDIRDRVSRARENLPDDAKEPIIAKQDADAQEVMWIAMYSDRYSTLELTEIADRQIKDRLQTIPGVGGVNFGGEKRKAIRLRLNAEKMAARNITASDLRVLLSQENVELPSGRVENLKRELTVLARGRMSKPDEFENLVIKYVAGAPVRIKDIALVEIGVENERSIARYNGQPAVGLGIVKQSEANAVDVADKVKEELERIKPILPANIELRTAYDSSVYVKEAITEVRHTLVISFLLVVGIIYLFLGNWRATFIPSVAIPVSIIGTFAIMYFLSFSVNILTLLALVLAIGVVVDDAIVVLENIYRHIENGLPPLEAALRGMKEISTAVISITITLVAVFLPIAFQRGTTGILFREFSVAVAGSVIVSAFVALTWTPMLCSKFLNLSVHHGHNRVVAIFDRLVDQAIAQYEKWLRFVLQKRWWVVGLALLSLAISGFFLSSLPREFLPEEDKGSIVAVIFGPEGATSEYTDTYIRQIEQIVKSYPEIEGFFSAVALSRGGPGQANFGIMFMRLKKDRDRSVQEIIRPGAQHSLFTRMFSEVKGVLAIAFAPKAIGGFSETYQLVLQCQDLKRLDEVARMIQGELAQAGFLSQPRINFNFEKPQLEVRIDRDKAAAMGVSVRDISETLQILMGGLEISDFNEGGKQYQVIAQLERKDRLTPQDLTSLYVRAGNGELVQSINLVRTREQGSVNGIYHFARIRSASIGGQPQGVGLGEAVRRTEAILAKKLPPDVTYEWDGEARELKDAGGDAILVFVLSVLIIYMVLAAQFESLIHPFTIMLALPLGFIGAFGSLWILGFINNFALIKFYAPAGSLPAFLEWLSHALPEIPSMTLNLYSGIGLILLMGLVTKNSILLVEFANQRMAEGLNAMEAMLEAGKVRLRPILMTAASTIIGIMPIALGLGAGGEGRRPLGIAVMGGMLTSTFLTLFVVPVFYVLFSRLTVKKN